MMAVLVVMHPLNNNGVAGGGEYGGEDGGDDDDGSVGGDAPLKCLQSYVSPLFSLLTRFNWQPRVFLT